MLMALVLLTTAGPDEAAYRREIDSWRQARESRLRADGGWLTLAGLFWLKPGATSFGADAANDIVLPRHASQPTPPSRAGTLVLDAGKVTIDVASGVIATLAGKPVTRAVLHSDAVAAAAVEGAAPDVLTLGSLTLQVIDRQGRLAIRLKDGQSEARQNWHGLRYYPTNPSLRVVARFAPHPKPVMITVPNVLGYSEALPSPGTALFEIDGKQMHLDPLIESPGDKQLFFVFRDGTAGKTTYGSGRFLYADPPRDGHVVLDFNKAYNPPCAFTAYATCPLPPEQNRLSIPIEAGELLYGQHPSK